MAGEEGSTDTVHSAAQPDSGVSRAELERALDELLVGQRKSPTWIAPAARRRFTVGLARVREADGFRLQATIPANGRPKRTALGALGWERTMSPTGKPYYSRPFATAPEAVEGIAAAYAIVYGETGDAAGWYVGRSRASAVADDGSGLALLVGCVVPLVAGLAGVVTAFVLLPEPVPRSWPVVVVAFLAAVAALVGGFVVVASLTDRIDSRSSSAMQGWATWGPTTIGLIAAGLAAYLVLRALPT
jgi:hypothetical protein